MELSKKNAVYIFSAAVMAFGLMACSKDEPGFGYTATTSLKPMGLIRIIPINPLDGTIYPVGTEFTPGSKQITFQNGITPNVWFALELSGWGPTMKLVGYSADIKLTYAYCPRPPCGCASTYVLEPKSWPCVTTPDCPIGSECQTTIGTCTTAYINKAATDFVFATISSTPGTTVISAFPNYTFAASLPSGSKADPGYPLIGGNLILRSGDFCGVDTSVQVVFNSAPKFFVSNGTTTFTTYPISAGAIVYAEGP